MTHDSNSTTLPHPRSPISDDLPMTDDRRCVSVVQDVAVKVKSFCEPTPAIWHWIGGPETLSHKSTVVDALRQAFGGIVAQDWAKTVGGATYRGVAGKVNGWHMMNCTLREINAAGPSSVTDAESPSLRAR